jgi:thiol:disulfide interchange protein
MKKNLLILAITVFALNACKSHYKPVLSSSQGINFNRTSLDSAQNNAKASHKPLFIFAHASWCPTCKEMERVVLVKKELGDSYNQDFVNVAIDIDSPAGKLLQKTYPIRATPTLFFFKADGSLAKKIEGAATVPELLAVEKQFSLKGSN